MGEEGEEPAVVLARIASTVAEIRKRGGDDHAEAMLSEARDIMQDLAALDHGLVHG